MPAGSHKYFEQIDPYGGRISVDDPEFVAQVRAKLGPKYKNLVDEKTKHQAANIGGPKSKYTQYGYRYRAEHLTPEELMGAKKEDAGLAINVGQLKDILSPDIYVYGLGAGASPRTFAHEFRHKEVGNEGKNRLLDVISSNSQPDYIKNLRLLYEHERDESSDDVPISELEKLLHRQLGLHALLNKKDPENYAAYTPSNWEDRKRTLENSGILSVLPDVAQQYVQRKAAMDRVAQPYLNFEGKE